MNIRYHHLTGEVTFTTESNTTWAHCSIHAVTPEIQAVIDVGGPFEWTPDDPEQPAGPGMLASIDPPLPPLRKRIKAVTDGFSSTLKASFPFERIKYWLDEGDADAARAVVDAVDVSGYPQEVQEAKAAILNEFDI